VADQQNEGQITLVRVPRKVVIPDEFREATARDQGTEYFQSFHFGTLVNYGHPLAAFEEAIHVLAECKSVDEVAYDKIHKGGPYYWLGMAAFIAKDYETAVYFMDAAVSQDLRRDENNLETPALLFIQLRGGHPAQAAKHLVEHAESQMAALVHVYNSLSGRPPAVPDLSLQDLRSLFLLESLRKSNSAWRSLATALISFVLEYDLRALQRDLVLSPSSFEPFLLHLFKGCILLESLVKLNPKSKPPGNTLWPALDYVKGHLGLGTVPQLSAAHLQDVINQLKSLPPTIQAAIEVAGKTRNTTGHSIGWEITITVEEYEKLYQCIGAACLHTIACLYRV